MPSIVCQFDVVSQRPKPWKAPTMKQVPDNKGDLSWRAVPDPEFHAWKDAVRAAARKAMRGKELELDGVRLELTFFRKASEPGGSSRWIAPVEMHHGQYRPRGRFQGDLTNLIKGTEDALQSVVFGNDCQVEEQVTSRRTGDFDGVRVVVKKIDPAE